MVRRRVVALDMLYSQIGRRTQVKATLGTADDFLTDYLYDDAGRLASIRQQGQTGGNAVADKRVDFTYDIAGNFQSLTRYADVAGANLVAATGYAFDSKNRLTGITHTDGATTPNLLSEYLYHYDAGDRIARLDINSPHYTDESTDYTYDATSQLTAADHATQTDEDYDWDANGNRTNDGFAAGDNNQLTSDGTFTYTYDEEGNRADSDADCDGPGR
jgi:YD repeat-containing protein